MGLQWLRCWTVEPHASLQVLAKDHWQIRSYRDVLGQMRYSCWNSCSIVADAGRQMNRERKREALPKMLAQPTHTSRPLAKVAPLKIGSPKSILVKLHQGTLAYSSCDVSVRGTRAVPTAIATLSFPLSFVASILFVSPSFSFFRSIPIDPSTSGPSTTNDSHLYLSWVIREPISLEYRAQSGIPIVYRTIACF
jgi:hypothetical protein